MVVKEYEEGLKDRTFDSIKANLEIVRHYEYCLIFLDYKEKIIIQNEVIEGKSGKWYLSYFSESAYYRIRTKAYNKYFYHINS